MESTKQECKNIIKNEGINLQSVIEYDVNGEIHSLTIESIVDSYMEASKESQEIFLSALKTSLETKENKLGDFFENMGQLLLMTHLSDKFTQLT